MYKFFRSLVQVTVFCAATMTIAVHAEQTSHEPSLPLIESQLSSAIQITGGTELIPLGASKVTIEEPRHAVVYVWPTDESTFEFFLYDGSLDGIEQFDANLGFNWRFSRNHEAWKAERIQYESLYEQYFKESYEYRTDNNPLMIDIGLFHESVMIDCLQTRFPIERSIRSFEGILTAWGLGRLMKPQYESILDCSPGMLNSLQYLDKEKYPNLVLLGWTSANNEQTYLISERADEHAERADEWREINRKLTGQ